MWRKILPWKQIPKFNQQPTPEPKAILAVSPMVIMPVGIKHFQNCWYHHSIAHLEAKKKKKPYCFITAWMSSSHLKIYHFNYKEPSVLFREYRKTISLQRCRDTLIFMGIWPKKIKNFWCCKFEKHIIRLIFQLLAIELLSLGWFQKVPQTRSPVWKVAFWKSKIR